MAVGIGLLLALVLGLLVVQGIFAPVLTRFFGLERPAPPPSRSSCSSSPPPSLSTSGGWPPATRRLPGIVCTGYWSSPWPSFFPWCSTWSWAKDSCPASMVPWAVGLVAHLPRRLLRGLLHRGHPRGDALRPQPEGAALSTLGFAVQPSASYCRAVRGEALSAADADSELDARRRPSDSVPAMRRA